MRLEVPTRYKAVYVRHGKRSQETAVLKTVVEVEIRDVDLDDAPVAHILGEDPVTPTAENPHPKHVPFAKIGGDPVEVRIIDGSYYVRTMSTESLLLAVKDAGDINPFNGYYKNDKEYLAVGVEEDHGSLPKDRATWEAQHVEARKWEDLRHLTVGAVATRAADMAIVDGWLYEKVSEPVLTLMLDERQVELRITEAAPDSSRYSRGRSNYHPGHCIRFGVDEYDRAVAEGARLAAERTASFVNRVEVRSHAPWHVRFRGECELAFSRAWSLLTAITPYAGSFDPLFGRAWHDLATALYEHDRTTVPMLDAMRRLCAMKNRVAEGRVVKDENVGMYHHVMGHSDHGGHELLCRFSGAEDALHMWDTRASEGIEWTEAGLAATATHDGGTRAYEVCDFMEADRISAEIGRDISHMTETAAAGKAFLVAVEDQGAVRAVCCVEQGDSGPAVTETVTAHGAEPLRRHLDLAVTHVVNAPGSDLKLDAELEAFGI